MPPENESDVVGTTTNPVAMSEYMRDKLKELESVAREFADILKSDTTTQFADKGEVIASAMLALRHIEDARMRYGKCIQYTTTGESSYPR